MFTDVNTGHVGLDRTELATVLVVGLGVEGIQLTGATAHPQHDAMAAPIGIIGDAIGKRGHPTTGRNRTDASRSRFDECSTFHDSLLVVHRKFGAVEQYPQHVAQRFTFLSLRRLAAQKVCIQLPFFIGWLA